MAVGSIPTKAEEPNDESIYGTEENPVIVTTYEQLVELYNDENHSTYIKLGNDITQIVTEKTKKLGQLGGAFISNGGFNEYTKSIDLNGKRLYLINDLEVGIAIYYFGAGTLEIKDSGVNGKIETTRFNKAVEVKKNHTIFAKCNFVLKSATIISDYRHGNGTIEFQGTNYTIIDGMIKNQSGMSALVVNSGEGIIKGDVRIEGKTIFDSDSQNIILGGSFQNIFIGNDNKQEKTKNTRWHPTLYVYDGNFISITTECGRDSLNDDFIYGGGDVYIYGGVFQRNDSRIIQNPLGKTYIAGGTFTCNVGSFNGTNYMITASDLEFASGAVVKVDGETVNNPTQNSFTLRSGQTRTITVTNDKLIKEFSINDTLNIGGTINDTLSTGNAGIKSIKAAWSREGTSQYVGKEVKYGNYSATIKITANEGYTLTNATKVTAFGKTLQGFTDGLNIADDGSSLTLKLSLYVDCIHDYKQMKGADAHWEVCSICHDKTVEVEHSFGSKVVDGSYDKYTCSECGFEKQIANAREQIVQVELIDTPAVEGNTISNIRLGYNVLGENGNDQMTITEQKWYKGSISSTNEIATGGKFESGNTYYAVLTLTAKGFYFFSYDNEENIGKSVSMPYSGGYNNDNLSESESVLKATIRYDVVERQNVEITLPDFVFGKTIGDIAEETQVTMNGVEVGFSLYIQKTVGGVSEIFDITYNADTDTYSSINDIVTTQATKLIAKQDYSVSILVDNDEKYVVSSDITVVNDDGLEYAVIGDSSMLVGLGSICFTTGDGCVQDIELNGITPPVHGEMPSNDYEIGTKYGVVKDSFTWNTNSSFKCGEEYFITVVVKATNDNWFSYYWTFATVDVPNATVKTVLNNETTATITISFGTLDHDFKLKHNETHHWYECDICNEKTEEVEHNGEVTCLESGHCSVCEIDYGTALGHDYTNGVEYTYDENGHQKKCSRCGEYSELEPHKFGEDNICSDCGYNKENPHVHSYVLEEPTLEHKVSDATCSKKATYCKSCECGAVSIEVFEFGEYDMNNHESDEFVFIPNDDGLTHTKKNLCCGTIVKDDDAHIYDSNNKCIECGVEEGHVHSYSSEWTKDDNEHWHACSCGAQKDNAHHEYDENGKCICGAEQAVEPNPVVSKPKEKGLPKGAIVGIVLGSVLVLGCGGFAVVWFIKKKKGL